MPENNNHNQQLILIVDDNAQNLQFLGNILAEKGYEIGVAQGGLQALNFIASRQPDLILLDIMMPEMDGYEVCKKLKERQYTRHIPVIFLTAKTESEDIVKGFEAGGVDYVTKPFKSAELLARVKTHLEMKILRGLIPICANCKNIRDDKGIWKKIEEYIESHSEALLSHSVCPDCSEKLYGHYDWFSKKDIYDDSEEK